MPQRHHKPSFSGAYPRERPSRRRGIRLLVIVTCVVVFFIILTSSPVPSAGAGTVKKVVFGPAVHDPPIKNEDKTVGEGKWYDDWGWLNPFSDSITSYENGVVLPPNRERPPIYAFYDTEVKKNEATQDAENKLLLIWRRAWWAQGFCPMILGRGEAMQNKLYASVQAKQLDPKIEVEVMRWLAWEQMGTGILANWLVLPMGPYDSNDLSYLRRGKYSMLTRYEGLGGGLLYGEKGAIRDALTTALDSRKLSTAKNFLDVFDKQRLSVDPKPDSIAFYESNIMSTKYQIIETALAEDKSTGLQSLAQLINSHLHLTFLNTFSTGLAILTPFPAHTLTLSQPLLSLAYSLASCPDSPMPGACPPNAPSCVPCVHRRPMQIATPTSYYNTSSLYTIGAIPHPYTLAALLAPDKEVTIKHIRRDTARDRWLHTVTESTLGREISGPARIVSFKETVAANWGSWRGLWMTESPAIPEHRDLEWHFGFSLPFVNTTSSLVPKNQQPTPKELNTQTQILAKAKELIKVKKKKKGSMDMRIKDAVEAWNLADTEAWRFVRALGRRETLVRKEWEKEEKEFAGGKDAEGRRKGWGRWFDRA